ncbi:MAG TPA: hypothetical protein VIE12_06365 [Actinomycetota bacterium]
MATIEVDRSDVEQFLSRFRVTVVDDDRSRSHHDVTLSGSDFERLAGRYATPESFIEACFGFLLARELKEQILPSFDVSQIGRYFPEFEREIVWPPGTAPG